MEEKMEKKMKEKMKEEMKEKRYRRICWLISSLTLAGVIVFLIGLYYWMIKAGIPYQDPPLELQIKYAVNRGIGETLLGKGFRIAVCGGTARLFLWWMQRRHQKEGQRQAP